MGESGSCRSTLVSRLPIFRRSVSKRQDSLPSSPSSGGVGNGVHTSSPSSTNSSNSSTGKRRSLFRTPSIRFSSKRNSEPPRTQTPPLDPAQDSNGSQANPQLGFHDGAGPPRAKTRHTFGFGGHRQKKITRSQTEDFEKVSSTANRNVFIKCITSGTNEGDDSGFLDDYSGGSKRSSRQKKQLLPKSFSAHHRFSKNSEQGKPLEVSIEPPTSGGTLGSWAGELLGESSLQSPMLSEDHTTALTPSEFNVPITEDTVSEVDALPAPSPAEPPDNNFSHVVSTSKVFFTPAQAATDKSLLPDTSTTNTTECETAIPVTRPATSLFLCLSVALDSLFTCLHASVLPSSRSPHQSLLFFVLCSASPVSMCSSGASPYHEVIRMERRLRSSSEGAGVPRGLHLNLKEPNCAAEGNVLLRKRNNSSSSKLGSLVGVYFVRDVDTKELEALNLLHYSPVDENGGVLGPLFPVVHNHLLCLDHVEGEVVVLAPQGQVSDLFPIVCLVVVGDQAYHCCVIGKLNDGVGVVPGRAVMSEQGVQEGTEQAPLRGPWVENQHGGCVVTYPYHMGAARQ
uniref:Coiled-coil serine-rich protein 1 n=1 Tax=Hucho hucho TaxID=62062 RepID=A0A4W5RW29_9TELE